MRVFGAGNRCNLHRLFNKSGAEVRFGAEHLSVLCGVSMWEVSQESVTGRLSVRPEEAFRSMAWQGSKSELASVGH